MQDLLLLDIGCGGRIGAVAELKGEYAYEDLDVIDLLGYGSIDGNKRRPIVPITGPMGRIVRRLKAEHGDDYLIRSNGAPLAEGARNWTQMIQRLVKRAGIDDTHKVGTPAANWYSIRRTFADFLDEYASDADISAVMGHFEITGKTRRQVFEPGSPTTEVYKRRKLSPVLRIGEILDREWWPRIQPFTKINLRADSKPMMHTDGKE